MQEKIKITSDASDVLKDVRKINQALDGAQKNATIKTWRQKGDAAVNNTAQWAAHWGGLAAGAAGAVVALGALTAAFMDAQRDFAASDKGEDMMNTYDDLALMAGGTEDGRESVVQAQVMALHKTAEGMDMSEAQAVYRQLAELYDNMHPEDFKKLGLKGTALIAEFGEFMAAVTGNDKLLDAGGFKGAKKKLLTSKAGSFDLEAYNDAYGAYKPIFTQLRPAGTQTAQGDLEHQALLAENIKGASKAGSDELEKKYTVRIEGALAGTAPELRQAQQRQKDELMRLQMSRKDQYEGETTSTAWTSRAIQESLGNMAGGDGWWAESMRNLMQPAGLIDSPGRNSIIALTETADLVRQGQAKEQADQQRHQQQMEALRQFNAQQQQTTKAIQSWQVQQRKLAGGETPITAQ